MYYCITFNFAIYIIIMASYAFNHFNIKRKELYWNKASDNEVLLEVANIIQKFDNSNHWLKNKNSILSKIKELNEYHIEFKIACYKSGIKYRLKEILSKKED